MSIRLENLSPALREKILARSPSAMHGAKIRPRAQPKPGQMNKLEEKYATEVLDIRKRTGEIVDYGFQTIKLRLADRTFYEPDYLVITEKEIQVHEVKGFWEDDARVKIKVAASLFWWFQFVAVRCERKEWVYETF